MVQVTGYNIRQNKEGKSFIALELSGEPELVQSTETGRYYMTSRRCSITSTLSEEQAKMLIGKPFPGKIQRQECDAYAYTIKETGEIISISHRYEYMPEEVGTMRVAVSNLAA